LEDVLREQLPPLSIVTDKKELPPTAEPAEIRENIAKALAQANGDWVVSYIMRSLAEEDRSQRCRHALAQELARRVSLVDRWLDDLLKEPALRDLAEKHGLDNSVVRLRDIALALGETIRAQRYRLQTSTRSGRLLSEFARLLAPIGQRQQLPRRLAEAGAAVVHLLDELLAIRLTLMDEAEIYEVLEPLKRWWSPIPYPRLLSEALTPIVDKIVAGIIFRARGGQRSESLLLRLRQALNDDKSAKNKLSNLARTENGLAPDIQDWLLGIERRPSIGAQANSRILSAVGEEGFIRAMAPAFMLAHEMLTSTAISKTYSNLEIQLASLVLAIGSQYGLEIVGKVGDRVEYSPAAHESVGGIPPLERHVEIIRPIVVRQRNDGSRDVITKGLVKPL
jgi:hypothetical protein